MGLKSFLSRNVGLPVTELVEIFLFTKCRNLNCKSVLAVDDCDCKICSGNKGFCSSCMCPICLTFDCASNNCSSVGCDVCYHWCHVAYGIQMNLIKPGPSLKGQSGTTEMQFHCFGCGHASEMFGFVKDVFLYYAKDWGLETLVKELDCVRRIFRGSDDSKGKELHIKADELCNWLRNKEMSASDACGSFLQFFNLSLNDFVLETSMLVDIGIMLSGYGVSYIADNSSPLCSSIFPFIYSSLKLFVLISLFGLQIIDADGLSGFPTSGACSKELTTQVDLREDESSVTPGASRPHKLVFYNTSSSRGHDLLPTNLRQQDLEPSLTNDLKNKNEYRFGRSSNADGFDSIESMVRIREAEAILFQTKADEARREVESYVRMIRANSEKLEEEYAEKLSKLCLRDTEERRRNKMEELKVLEHILYFIQGKMLLTT
ncbi:putative transmembrane ascorbate ferrireductase 3-like [Hibiscus syriacus]|uniref:Transmembrane ascorbate ferrireductase 3-like n=1 Tax=Hibiscus syriacus TaxID=106335 RepID=A0A6A2Y7Z4_HIBSY|nr:putative transmembrane ascorbate ferrireductase 3-like [Hibiscus syriacus]